MPSYVDERPLDVIIIGAGFGGCYLLHNLRKQGFRARIFEEGNGLGGVWWHNRYPGARVDTDVPFYEFSDPEIWSKWNWSERYPGQRELVRYFEFVDSKWDLSKDISFGSRVDEASFDSAFDQWTIRTHGGEIATARFFLPSMGFAAKMYIPPLKGLDDFQGFKCHTARWPEKSMDLAGKRIGIIGTGATGVQLVQELGPAAGKLIVFQRSPNCALPMRQRMLSEEGIDKSGYPNLFSQMRKTSGGFTYPVVSRTAMEDTPEQQRMLFEKLWEQGGFAPTHGNYADFMTNLETNHLFYNFWRDKVRQRLLTDDPELIENLAPEKPPYPFSTKRSSLEQTFYEVLNQDNVSLVSLVKNPIDEVIPEGVRMSDGAVHELDALLLATGFDAVTGSFSRINIQGLKGRRLKDAWAGGARTFLGMTTSGFPNMIYQYGPQSPSATAIGPVISEIQGNWIIATLTWLRDNGYKRIDARPEAEAEWGCRTTEVCNKTLLPLNTTSWYMGGNVPGKPRQALNWMAGLPEYQAAINECFANSFSGFKLE